MIVKYSVYPSPSGTLQLTEHKNGEWLRVSDLIAAMKGISREVGAFPSDDPGTVLKRATVALGARREKIVALETELARRNSLVGAPATCSKCGSPVSGQPGEAITIDGERTCKRCEDEPKYVIPFGFPGGR